MSLLLDTTAVSEITKPMANPGFMTWFAEAAAPEDRRQRVFVSVLVIGEIQKGILKLDQGARRDRLSRQRDLILARYDARILLSPWSE